MGFVRPTPVPKQVQELTSHALDNGISGIVCSPLEIEIVRKLGSSAFIVTPGIRTGNSPGDDQKRTLSAAEAMTKGANMLVVGRPILKASSRLEAAKSLLNEFS